jgi:hypothetical protein
MKLKLLTALVLLWLPATSFAAPHQHTGDAKQDMFIHNIGPADFYPGTTVPPDRVVYPAVGRPYGIYDGIELSCKRSSATYRQQSGRRASCK